MKKRLSPSPLPLLAIAATLLLSACHSDSFRIEGQLQGGENRSLWLEEIAPEGTLFIDSIALDSKGRFSYRCTMPYRSLYSLHSSEEDFVVLLPDYGEKITVGGTITPLASSYTVTGSPESTLLWQLQQFSGDGGKALLALIDTTNHYAAMLKAGLVDDATVAAKKQETDSIYRTLFVEQQEYVCRFIEDNRGSLATLIALYKPFNNRPLLDPRTGTTMDYFDIVLEGLQEALPDNPHTQHFKNTAEHLRSALARQNEE